ncbi:MAG: hypothetical protein AAFU80_18890 [Pseudomonadota bacterium]
MRDPQIKEFNQRLKRIDRIHRSGGGFEAAGTLGQSHYTRMRRRAGRPVLRPALAILFGVVLFKAISSASMGNADYVAQVETMRAGGVGEKVAAFVMAPDPISATLAEWMAPLFS